MPLIEDTLKSGIKPITLEYEDVNEYEDVKIFIRMGVYI